MGVRKSLYFVENAVGCMVFGHAENKDL